MAKIKILVVEDESIVAKDLQNTLQNLGYKVPAVASSGQAAIEAAEKHKPDLILMDIVLKGKMDGIEAAEQISSRFNIPAVYLTAYTDDKTLERAKITDPFGYIVKPFEDRQLKTVIVMALYKVQMNNKLRQASKQWETTFNSICDMVSIHDEDFKLVKVNKAFARALKIEPKDVTGRLCYELLHGAKEPPKSCPHKQVLQTGKPAMAEFFEPHLGIYLEISASPIFDNKGKVCGTVHITKDITKRKQAEQQIEASLKEKEILLRELHHRVKNNMQVISSLLRLQSGTLDNNKAIVIFEECQNRVRSMALIHEKFYRSKDLTNIDFKVYVKELTQNLIQSYGISPGKITVDINIKDISLGIDTAIPCGLLINELISNCLKHAFPEKIQGQIKVSLQPVGKNQIELVISDNGVGISDKLDFRKTESLGLQLVNTLVKDQLDGQIELDKSAGTKFKITFKEMIGGGK